MRAGNDLEQPTQTNDERLLAQGVRGTDNCPVCGRTMQRRDYRLLDLPIVQLVCKRASHDVEIRLRTEA